MKVENKWNVKKPEGSLLNATFSPCQSGYLKLYCADVLFPFLGETGMIGEERVLFAKIISGF